LRKPRIDTGGTPAAGCGSEGGRYLRVDHRTHRADREQDAQRAAERLVEPDLQQLGQRQHRGARRGDDHDQAQAVVDPDAAVHEAEAGEARRLQRHTPEDQGPQPHVVDDPAHQRQDGGADQRHQREHEGDVAARPAELLLHRQHHQAEG